MSLTKLIFQVQVAAAESERAAASGVLARLRARCSVLAEKKDAEAAAIRQLQLESVRELCSSSVVV